MFYENQLIADWRSLLNPNTVNAIWDLLANAGQRFITVRVDIVRGTPTAEIHGLSGADMRRIIRGGEVSALGEYQADYPQIVIYPQEYRIVLFGDRESKLAQHIAEGQVNMSKEEITTMIREEVAKWQSVDQGS